MMKRKKKKYNPPDRTDVYRFVVCRSLCLLSLCLSMYQFDTSYPYYEVCTRPLPGGGGGVHVHIPFIIPFIICCICPMSFPSSCLSIPCSAPMPPICLSIPGGIAFAICARFWLMACC